jgi:hypothetical protein
MLKVRSLVGVAAALITMPLAALPAWADACLFTPVATFGPPITFNTSGPASTSCSVDGVTFSNMTITVNQGTINNVSLLPTTIGNESGFQLNYSAGNGTAADFTWSFTVAGNILSDAFAALNATSGPATLTEQLFSNGNPTPTSLLETISLAFPAPLSQTVNIIPPQFSLLAVKDQFTGVTGSTSSLINTFSVPGPVVGAGLPGLVAACGGLIGLARRRRRRIA